MHTSVHKHGPQDALQQLFVASSWSSVLLTSLCLQGCEIFGKRTTISSDGTFEKTCKCHTLSWPWYWNSLNWIYLLLIGAAECGVSAFCTCLNEPEKRVCVVGDKTYCILLQLTTQQVAPRRNLTLPACKLLNPAGICAASRGFVSMAFDCPMWICFHGFWFLCVSLPPWISTSVF